MDIIVDTMGDAVVDGRALRISSIASQSVGLANTWLQLPRSSSAPPSSLPGNQVALASAPISFPTRQVSDFIYIHANLFSSSILSPRSTTAADSKAATPNRAGTAATLNSRAVTRSSRGTELLLSRV